MWNAPFHCVEDFLFHFFFTIHNSGFLKIADPNHPIYGFLLITNRHHSPQSTFLSLILITEQWAPYQ